MNSVVTRQEYLAFELLIGEKRRDGFLVTIIESPTGEAEAICDLEIGPDITAILRAIEMGKANHQLLRDVGSSLFEKLFTGNVATCYRSSLALARNQQKGLRIRLRISPPAVAALPWEILYDSRENSYLAVSAETAIVRYVPLSLSARPILLHPPLRVLAVISNPHDLYPLAVEREEFILGESLRQGREQGLVEFRIVQHATTDGINHAMRSFRPHVFHFVGHGQFDNDTAFLALENSRGAAHLVEESLFQEFFADEQDTRLVVLNACQSATISTSRPLVGIAPRLLQRHIPAVVAMRNPISDQAAIIFTREFYRSLVAGYPVDASIAHARKEIYQSVGHSPSDWSAPVLFLRSRDGVLFQIESPVIDRGTRASTVETGGGAHIGGDVTVDRDFVGRDQISRTTTYNIYQAPAPPEVDSSATGARFQAPSLNKVPHFSGRRLLLERLELLLTGEIEHPIVGLVGIGGVGKSATAIYLAHQLRSKFSDGVLWADLGASTPEAAEAELKSFVQPFGQEQGFNSQLDLQNKAKFVRDALFDRRILFVIDNVDDAEQMDLFLPSGTAHRTLITTQNRAMLVELGATIIDVTPWSVEESVAFLQKVVAPERVAAELEHAQGIARRVGGLPMALRLVANYLSMSPVTTLAEYDDQLREEESLQRTAFRSNTMVNLYRIFDLSFRRLNQVTQELFPSLAAFDGPDFGSHAVAAVNECAPYTAQNALAELWSHSLISDGLGERESMVPLQLHGVGRYRLHPLLKTIARSKLREVELFRRRLAEYCADYAQQHGDPGGYHLLDFEWQNIVSTLEWGYEHNMSEALIQGVLGLTRPHLGQLGFLDVRGHWSVARTLLDLALKPSEPACEPAVKAHLLMASGGFAIRQAEHQLAKQLLDEAFQLFTSLPLTQEVLLLKLHLYDFLHRTLLKMNRRQEAQQQLELGLKEAENDPRPAIQHMVGYLYIQLSASLTKANQAKEAIQVAQRGLAQLPEGSTHARISGLINLGIAHQYLAQTPDAVEAFGEAMPLAEQLGDARRIAGLLGSLGWNEMRLGDLDGAIQHFSRALALYERLRDRQYAINTMSNLASVYIRRSEYAKALQLLKDALQASQSHQLDESEAFIQSNFVDLYLRMKQPSLANTALAEAYQHCTDQDIPFLLPTVLRQKAEHALAIGNPAAGVDLIERALTLAQQGKDAEEQGISFRVKGCIMQALGRWSEAAIAWQASWEILEEQDPFELAKTKLEVVEAVLGGRDGGIPPQLATEWLVDIKQIFERQRTPNELERTQALSLLYLREH